MSGFHDADSYNNNTNPDDKLSVTANLSTGGFGFQYTTQYNINGVGLGWFDSGCRTNGCGFSSGGTMGILLNLDDNEISMKFNNPTTNRPVQAFTNTGNYRPSATLLTSSRLQFNFGDSPYTLGLPAGYANWAG